MVMSRESRRYGYQRKEEEIAKGKMKDEKRVYGTGKASSS